MGCQLRGLEAFLFVDEGGEKVEVVIASWYQNLRRKIGEYFLVLNK